MNPEICWCINLFIKNIKYVLGYLMYHMNYISYSNISFCLKLARVLYWVTGWPTRLRHTLVADHVPQYAGQVGCVLAPVAFGQGRLTQMPGRPSICILRLRLALLEPQGAISPGTSPFQRHLFLGECWQGSRHFRNHQVCVGYSLVPDSHNKKGHVPYSSVCGFVLGYTQFYFCLTTGF